MQETQELYEEKIKEIKKIHQKINKSKKIYSIDSRNSSLRMKNKYHVLKHLGLIENE